MALLRVQGTSMRPRLEPADWLVVDFDRRPRFGDIAVARREGRLVAHRLVSVVPRRMQGDAIDSVERVAPEEHLGTAVAYVRHGARTDLLAPRQRWTGRRVAARAWLELSSTKASRLLGGRSRPGGAAAPRPERAHR